MVNGIESFNILTTTVDRSFWEKATILHQEAYRPENAVIPSRYSRHYRDSWRFSSNPVKKRTEKSMLQDRQWNHVLLT